MFKDKLKELGLEPDAIKKIVSAHQEELANTYVPKTRFDEEREAHKATKETLSEREKAIESLKKLEGQTEEMKKQLEDISQKAKADAEDWQKQQEQLEAKQEMERKKMALALALSTDEKLSPIDVEYVSTLFSIDDIKLKDGESAIDSGFKEQFEKLTEARPQLFVKRETEPQTKGWNFQGTTPPDGDKNPGNTATDAESFGKNLAKSVLQRRGITDKNKED